MKKHTAFPNPRAQAARETSPAAPATLGAAVVCVTGAGERRNRAGKSRWGKRRVARLLSACALLVAVSSVQAQSLSHVPAAFLDVGLDAQAMGVAGARSALVHDVSAVLWNPAGLWSVRQQQILISATRQFGLVPYHTVLYARPLLGRPMAIGAITAGDEVLRENTALLSGAHRFPGIATVGVTVKFYQASFGNNSGGAWEFQHVNRQVQGSAFGAGLDIGVRRLFLQKLVVSLVAKNLFSYVDYKANNQAGTAKGGSETIPTQWRIGLGMLPQSNTYLEFDLLKATHLDVRDRFHVGVERTFFRYLTLRSGYAQNLDAAEPNRLISVGAGTALNLTFTGLDFGVDVAYLFSELQNFLHISVRFGW